MGMDEHGCQTVSSERVQQVGERNTDFKIRVNPCPSVVKVEVQIEI
jgi:type 1 fimbria pilin